MPRITLEDIVLDDTLVPAGKILSLSTLSALRDPALYAEPEHFDIHRTDAPKRQLVFGGGVHRCLGEALAMIELEEGLAAMAQRLPDMRLDGNPVVVQVGSAFGRRKTSASAGAVPGRVDASRSEALTADPMLGYYPKVQCSCWT